jgi:hypothetical protein
MSVGDNESTSTKNADESMAISIAMAMQRYDVRREAHPPMEHIQGFTRSHWMPPSGECLRRIAPAAAMVDDFEKTHKTLTKHNF